ncbi:alpha-2-HS-glycoprotein-like [Xyrauchen texanus]|uniref:alpha-2-HS-glycoprotein-like n=1 Tax=Xyrauchen texanus TaxID=154827 RepID=UPI0022421C75|nr:alpha-2-HS-glycoprotein-like [Xyrauchen texanus]
MSVCSMRQLVTLAILVLALCAASEVEYKCLEDQDSIATDAAEKFINDHHRHGYKFKFVSLDSRTAEEKADPCEVVFRITLEESVCHIVNPKPVDQCEVRSETETIVTAKCNVTITSIEGKAAVKNYICDTEPGSHQSLVMKCPDCRALLPLHDPTGLESMKSALQKYNKESNHMSYFKLMEMGRISTQWMLMGQSFFAEFAIVETDCPNKESQNRDTCKALCGDKARYGFCKSTKVGNNEPRVECNIYEAQNSSHPFQSRDCGPPPRHHHHHHHHHHHPGHHPDHAHPHHPDHAHPHRPDHAHPHHPDHAHPHRPDHAHPHRPDHAHPHRPDHEDKKMPDQRGRPEHVGHRHKNKTSDHKDWPEHVGHSGKDKPWCPKHPLGFPESGSEGHHEFPCHGFVKIPPSIYPICPFPPSRPCRGPPELAPPPKMFK